MKLQRTIENPVKFTGKGLFGGQDVKMTVLPAPANTGIVFVRTDTPEQIRIAADISNLVERGRRTALRKGQATIETTEHFLAAVSGLELDNLIIEINAPELPGLDGSSLEFLRNLKKAGAVEQQSEKKEIIVNDPITISEGDSFLYALPCSGDTLSITYDLDYTSHTGIGRQLYSFELSPENFERNIAPSRTFLLEAEAKQFQARGVGIHLSPRDILVISSDGPIKNSYRFEDECVRHKIADLIGDLMLAGRAVKGRIVCYKSGHTLNHQLAARLKQIAQQQDKQGLGGTGALLDIRKIQRILPHRYPFLLVDKVVEIEPDRRIVGIKNVTFNEQFFQGHFPSTPIMPGVLIVEALAQVCGLLFAQTLENTGKLAVLVSMDNVRIRKSVVPGDQMKLVGEVVKVRSRTGHCKCTAIVDNEVAAEADIKFMLVDNEQV